MALGIKFDDVSAGSIGSAATPQLTKPIERIGATHERIASGYLTWDNSYPTGGYAVSAATLGVSTVAGMFIEPSGGYTFVYNRSTGKIQAYSGVAEVANATNLSALQKSYFRAHGVV